MCIQPDRQSGNPPDAARSGITEAVLAALWNRQTYIQGPMWDCAGKPVAVIYRGRWTAGNGPDFENAMLSTGAGHITKGSVEMHLRCADWWAHGHDTDPRYNSVVLHVVLWPNAARPVTRQDGTEVPTLVLADYITLPASELVEKVSPLLPQLGTLSEEPCWQRTQAWPIERILAVLDEAGDARLLSKAAVIDADIEVYGLTDQVLYAGLSDSLGYSANREPMRAIAQALTVETLLTLPLERDASERAMLLEGVLLGAAGMLPSQRPETGPLDYISQEYSRELEEIWQANAHLVGLYGPVAAGWTLNRVRPANSPPRRLAALASLLARLLWRPEPGGMLGPFLHAQGAPLALARIWTELLQVPAEGYWATHSDFGKTLPVTASEGTALVGASRAGDMVANVLLPAMLAYAEREGDPGLRSKVLEVYAALPALEENKITRAMLEEALGPRKRGVTKQARRQQGLIHLYRLYCEAQRCYECPISGYKRL